MFSTISGFLAHRHIAHPLAMQRLARSRRPPPPAAPSTRKKKGPGRTLTGSTRLRSPAAACEDLPGCVDPGPRGGTGAKMNQRESL
jgi:hypothetical protein